MAGHVLNQYLLNKGYQVEGVARAFYKRLPNEHALDVSDSNVLKDFIVNGQYDVVVNCIGVLIGDSEKDFQRAIHLNGYLPRELHNWSKKHGFKVVLLSTDCVFDGKVGGYSERDNPNAGDSYGISKRLGEVIGDESTLTIRTSIIGPELKNGTGLWRWFESQKGKIYGYAQVYWSGVTTLELARFIEFAINNDLKGLVQLTNGKPISKYDLLTLLCQAGVNGSVEIQKRELPRSNKSLLASDLKGFSVRSYYEMIVSQIEFTQELG